MPDAKDTPGTVFKNGTLGALARVVGANCEPIVQSDISTVRYSIYQLDDQDPDARTPVAGHANMTLNVVNVVFDTLQTDAVWTADSIGYNFRHVVDIRSQPAFASADCRYLLEYTLTPVEGQPMLVRFLLTVI